MPALRLPQQKKVKVVILKNNILFEYQQNMMKGHFL